jgi:hypothetical protein
MFRNRPESVALVLSALLALPSILTAQDPPDRPGGGDDDTDEPKAYTDVITAEAVTKNGLFDVHEVDDKLFFEIPVSSFGADMLLIGRAEESTTQDPGSFFGSGPLGRLYVTWEHDDDRVVLRAREYDLTADPGDAIWGQVSHFRKGPVLQVFDIETYADDGSAVIDVSNLFISNIPELRPVEGIQSGKSWVEDFWALDDRVNVAVTQTGQSRANGNGGGGGGPGGTTRGSDSTRAAPGTSAAPIIASRRFASSTASASRSRTRRPTSPTRSSRSSTGSIRRRRSGCSRGS